MKEKWQEEQKLVISLQSEVQYKDENLMRL
jgi:hypothetical protein